MGRLLLRYPSGVLHTTSISSDLSIDMMTSYNAPVITDLMYSSNMPTFTNGGRKIIIVGTDFGPVGPLKSTSVVNSFGISKKIKQRIEYHWKINKLSENFITTIDSCSTTKQEADVSEITCMLQEGTGDRLEWRITIGGQTSAIWKSTCLKNTWLTDFKGHVDCQQYADESDCPSDINKARINALKDIGLDPTLDELCASSFAEPVIHRIEGQGMDPSDPSVVTDMQDMKTVGGELVAIYGENFGPRSSHRVVTYQKMNNQPGIKGKIYTCCTLPECGCSDNCRISNDAEVHTKIICKTESGIGKNLKFTVKVGPALDDATRPVNTANLLAYRTSLPSAGTYRYEGPKITSIEGFK